MKEIRENNLPEELEIETECDGQDEIEAEKENKEYSFEEGVKQIMERIDSLLSSQDYVVVAIAGPLEDDTNVGKSFLEGRLWRECRQRDIPLAVASDETTLGFLGGDADAKNLKEKGGGVLILGAMGSSSPTTQEYVERNRAVRDSRLSNAAKSIGLPVTKIDLRVLIYRPDKPARAGEYMYNDIVIRNEQAVDDKNKIGYKK